MGWHRGGWYTAEARCSFAVTELEPDHHLVLHSEDHLPPGWKERFGAWIDWTWAFVLDDIGSGQTRFIFRSRERAGPGWAGSRPATSWRSSLPTL
jgi:hypothetical protein